jgi:hypothetical protein
MGRSQKVAETSLEGRDSKPDPMRNELRAGAIEIFLTMKSLVI